MIDTGYFLFDEETGLLKINTEDVGAYNAVIDNLTSNDFEWQKLAEVFEHWFCNSDWALNVGDDMGVLTGAEILYQGHWSDKGEVMWTGDFIYVNDRYCFDLISEKLIENGEFQFKKVKREKFNGVVLVEFSSGQEIALTFHEDKIISVILNDENSKFELSYSKDGWFYRGMMYWDFVDTKQRLEANGASFKVKEF